MVGRREWRERKWGGRGRGSGGEEEAEEVRRGKEKGRGRKEEGGKKESKRHQCPAGALTRYRAWNLGMFSDLESNSLPFCVRVNAPAD